MYKKKVDDCFQEASHTLKAISQIAMDDEMDQTQLDFEEVEKKYEDLQLDLQTRLDTASATDPSKEVINDTGYQPAWDRVDKRFDNKWEIVQAVFSKLMSQNPVTAQSLTALRTLVDTTTECVSLVVLERPVTTWDDILIYAVVQKLDHDSRRQWELSLTSSDHPSFQSLVDFLEQRARALSSIEPIKAIVKIRDAHGGQQLCRVMLDNGSQRSLVTESFAQRLSLPRNKINVSIAGVEGNISASSRGIVNLLLSSIPNPNFNICVETLVIPKITGDTPTCPTPVNSWPHILNLNLAGPNFSEPGPIDVLFGANILNEIYIDGRRKGPPGTPTAYNSMLGWVLLGPASELTSQNISTSLIIQDSLDAKLGKFWKMQEMPSVSNFTPEEMECEQHFVDTHQREASGRYVVKLPFKPGHSPLGQSRNRALSRFQQQEARLQRNLEHKTLYDINFMREYESLGHMVQIPSADIKCEECSFYYLPHHAVFKWSSSTTKCRVVLDASCKSSSGMSLNDILMNGPIIQDNLFTHLLRFRLHAIPFVGYIEKMYRIICVTKEHWNFHRILWREDPALPLKEYWLTLLTFGTKSAPFLAKRSLRQCAMDARQNFPIAFTLVQRDFYVDNLMSGCSSLPEAIEAARQLPLMMERGNFNLREWFSSDVNLLNSIPEALRGTQKMIAFENDDSVGTLGLRWHLAFDSFKYQVNTLRDHSIVTKRSIVSDLASLYDPLGWLSPIMVIPKDLIRKMWQRKLQWDDEVPDASELAYSAAVYIRVVTNNEDVHVDLVTAKDKIAPVSQRSIPRLELCGAMLLSRPMRTVHSTLEIQFEEFHAWTDSQVVDTLPIVDSDVAIIPERALEEEKAITKTTLVNNSPTILQRFSSFQPMCSILAYCLRFVQNCRASAQIKKGLQPYIPKNSDFLSADESRRSLQKCIKICQQQQYQEEIRLLLKKKPFHSNSKIVSLSPFVDPSGILLVGGRIQKADIPEERKHPILLPRSHHLTTLIIKEEHCRLLHAGPQAVLASLTSRYWIVNSRDSVRAVVGGALSVFA
ncbi:unnamed protein product [Allacma fusca]|uniref:Peptidase aspartic putative domain-containing protein n=1 Tax=Allacma fusca TaxID=39272 RepID=A0A8J2KAW8_9HEXA|nr:unnamed protein product [Allacma fusca]